MKTSDIYSILTEKEFEKVKKIFFKYALEYNDYKKALAKKGSSIHFKTEIDYDFVFTKVHLSQLAKLFIKDILSELELNFIVDNIFASINSFEGETIRKELEGLTDPEINGHITKEDVARLC